MWGRRQHRARGGLRARAGVCAPVHAWSVHVWWWGRMTHRQSARERAQIGARFETGGVGNLMW